MNLKLKELFRGKVVNKALTRNTGVGEFPRYPQEDRPSYVREPLSATSAGCA